MPRIAIALMFLVVVSVPLLAAEADQAPAPHPFAGSYPGTFEGDLSGSLQVTVGSDGVATVTVTAQGQTGTITGRAAPTGEVWFTANMEGQQVLGAGLLRREAGAVVGNGAWIVSEGMKGTWRVGASRTAPAGANAWAGPYKGSFSGPTSGGVTFLVGADGKAQGAFDTTVVGKIDLAGTVSEAGEVALTGTVQGMELAVKGTLTKDAAGIVGKGTWAVATYSGEWEVKAGEAPAQ